MNFSISHSKMNGKVKTLGENHQHLFYPKTNLNQIEFQTLDGVKSKAHLKNQLGTIIASMNLLHSKIQTHFKQKTLKQNNSKNQF